MKKKTQSGLVLDVVVESIAGGEVEDGRSKIVTTQLNLFSKHGAGILSDIVEEN